MIQEMMRSALEKVRKEANNDVTTAVHSAVRLSTSDLDWMTEVDGPQNKVDEFASAVNDDLEKKATRLCQNVMNMAWREFNNASNEYCFDAKKNILEKIDPKPSIQQVQNVWTSKVDACSQQLLDLYQTSASAIQKNRTQRNRGLMFVAFLALVLLSIGNLTVGVLTGIAFVIYLFFAFNMTSEKNSEIENAVKSKAANEVETCKQAIISGVMTIFEKVFKQYNNAGLGLKREDLEVFHQFVADADRVARQIMSLPKKAGQLAADNLFDRDFIARMKALADQDEVDMDKINSIIEVWVRDRKPFIDKIVSDELKRGIKEVVGKYLQVVQSFSTSLQTTSAISMRDLEDAVSRGLMLQSSSVSFSGHNIEGLTDLVIGAGVIGAGVISGGAGMALIASGPVGWIAGAVIGGLMLTSDGARRFIKGVMRAFGFGMNGEKMQTQLYQVAGKYGSGIIDALNPECRKVSDQLQEATRKIVQDILAKTHATSLPNNV